MSKEQMTQFGLDIRDTKSKRTSQFLMFPALVAIIISGDFLLWGYYAGVSYALFLSTLVIFQALTSVSKSEWRGVSSGLLISSVALLPVVESLNVLSACIASVGVFSGCFMMRARRYRNGVQKVQLLLSAMAMAATRFPRFVIFKLQKGKCFDQVKVLGGWVIPAALALVFVLLFASASPVWEAWLNAIDVREIAAFVFNPRLYFWIALGWFSWPFIETQLPKVAGFLTFTDDLYKQVSDVGKDTAGVSTPFFQKCLVLFNIVFAGQTFLDLSYLWGSVELPAGMTFAEYAHRGAYPLVAAALLAGLFVLIAMRPGGPGEQSTTVKWLLLAWVGQNLILVVSSIERLNLYVGAYALTYWRIAAFIWMGLVAVGLVLIVVRFATGKSTAWLLSSNFVVLVFTLYVTSLVNLPGVIMSFNLNHLNQKSDSRVSPDWNYLASQSDGAYPALVRFQTEPHPELSVSFQKQLRRVSRILTQSVEWSSYRNWRTWSFRQQRSYWVLEEEKQHKEHQRLNGGGAVIP